MERVRQLGHDLDKTKSEDKPGKEYLLQRPSSYNVREPYALLADHVWDRLRKSRGAAWKNYH